MLEFKKYKDEETYKTKDLYICDIRMITFRRGEVFLVTDLPFYAFCKKMPGEMYMDVLSGVVYECEKMARKVGSRHERFVLSARKCSQAMLAAYPTMTIEDIKQESYRLNDLTKKRNIGSELENN